MRIKWIKGDIEVVGIGKAELGKEIEIPQEIAQSLILQGIAKLSKASKIKQKDSTTKSKEQK